MTKPKKLKVLTRREALRRGALALGGGSMAILLAPMLRFFAYPATSATTEAPDGFIPAGELTLFKKGLPRKVSLSGNRRDAWATRENVEIGSVWVHRTSDDQFQVYSTVCPHLGCAISHTDDHFVCPCHGSHFEVSGARRIPEGGQNPSPRDMDTLEWRVENGELQVKYQRFKQGQEEKEALG